MAIEGWFYLHENGDLIYKRETDGGTAADIRESPFARALWPVDPADREGAWRILVEALAFGAKPERVAELAVRWGCDDSDAQVYAEHVGARLSMDGDAWCATRTDFVNIQESPCGFGKTALDAMAKLCKALDVRPAKMWGLAFKDALRPRAA